MAEDSVIAEGDLIVELGDFVGGGQSGSAVLEDITLTFDKENSMHHGIGNKDPVDHTSGNRTYSIDSEVQVSEAVYDAMKTMYQEDTPAKGALLDDSGVVDVNIGRIVWNQIELAATDGEDFTVSFQADCYQVAM